MSIPLDPADPANFAPSLSSSDSQTKPTVSSLPPEALDLATRLFNLSRTGSTSYLQPYITAGIPPNLTNQSGDTLLMLAAYHGHVSTVKMLLSHGADPNVLNDRGQSPLAGAVFKGHGDVVRALVEGGADSGLGQPSAKDCVVMFRRSELRELLGVEEEEGLGPEGPRVPAGPLSS